MRKIYAVDGVLHSNGAPYNHDQLSEFIKLKAIDNMVEVTCINERNEHKKYLCDTIYNTDCALRCIIMSGIGGLTQPKSPRVFDTDGNRIPLQLIYGNVRRNGYCGHPNPLNGYKLPFKDRNVVHKIIYDQLAFFNSGPLYHSVIAENQSKINAHYKQSQSFADAKKTRCIGNSKYGNIEFTGVHPEDIEDILYLQKNYLESMQ